MKKRTRLAVSEIYLDMIDCLKDATPLLTVFRTEYLVVVVEEVLQ
jgi:hypothetical protein